MELLRIAAIPDTAYEICTKYAPDCNVIYEQSTRFNDSGNNLIHIDNSTIDQNELLHPYYIERRSYNESSRSREENSADDSIYEDEYDYSDNDDSDEDNWHSKELPSTTSRYTVELHVMALF